MARLVLADLRLLLEDRHADGRVAQGELVGGGEADDAAADDEDITNGQGGISVIGLQ
jgi:hypothetical protein